MNRAHAPTGSTSHKADPEAFFAAVDHALRAVEAGAHKNICLRLADGAARAGRADAAEGFTHAYLRLSSIPEAEAVKHSSVHCRVVTRQVNHSVCRRCRLRDPRL